MGTFSNVSRRLSGIKKCEKLVYEKMKNSKGRSKHLRKQIKEQEKIENPNILQKYCLCSHYQTLFHVPFDTEPNILLNLCKDCSFNQSSEEIMDALHSKEYGELVWGKVYFDK